MAFNSCNMVLDKVLFPQPDSPINPKESPGKISKLILSTALIICVYFKKKLCWIVKYCFKFSILNKGFIDTLLCLSTFMFV